MASQSEADTLSASRDPARIRRWVDVGGLDVSMGSSLSDGVFDMSSGHWQTPLSKGRLAPADQYRLRCLGRPPAVSTPPSTPSGPTTSWTSPPKRSISRTLSSATATPSSGPTRPAGVTIYPQRAAFCTVRLRRRTAWRRPLAAKYWQTL